MLLETLLELNVKPMCIYTCFCSIASCFKPSWILKAKALEAIRETPHISPQEQSKLTAANRGRGRGRPKGSGRGRGRTQKKKDDDEDENDDDPQEEEGEEAGESEEAEEAEPEVEKRAAKPKAKRSTPTAKSVPKAKAKARKDAAAAGSRKRRGSSKDGQGGEKEEGAGDKEGEGGPKKKAPKRELMQEQKAKAAKRSRKSCAYAKAFREALEIHGEVEARKRAKMVIWLHTRLHKYKNALQQD